MSHGRSETTYTKMAAKTDHPVHEIISSRWSPYAFDEDAAVDDDDLRSILEAARWAPSSYNEQPWRYIVANRRNDPDLHSRILSCLVEGNRAWARRAPVLMLGIVRTQFEDKDKPNRAARHDLGLASGNLTVEATARGLSVHQMIGIQPDRVRETFDVPDGFEPMTGLAVGYAADPSSLPEKLRDRDRERRPRKPLHEIVFGDRWGRSADLVRSDG